MNQFQSPEQSTVRFSACDCGNVNVNYKSVTLHFSRKEFYEYATAITQFLCQMRMGPTLYPTFPEAQAILSPPYIEMDKDCFD